MDDEPAAPTRRSAEAGSDPRIVDTILELVQARGPTKSICPSEVARAIAVAWRPLMRDVRAAAVALARDGRVDILRHGKRVEDVAALRGVWRIRLR